MADASVQRDCLSRLPVELKCAVVRYLPALKDRQTLSLLNKDWAIAVMPIMWETFTTDLLVKKGPRNVLGLAHPDSNIVKHVRRIHLLDRLNSAKEEDQLPRLLAAIPRDQLSGFKSRNGVAIDTFQLLVQMQTKLDEFDIFGARILQVLQSPWTRNSLSGLTRMDIVLDTLTPDDAQKLWAHFPRLNHIRLMRTSTSAFTPTNLQGGHFGSDENLANLRFGALQTSTMDPIRLRLVSLYIGNFVLPPTFNTTFKRIDIVALNELVLDGTTRVAELLEAMCSDFQKQRPSLRKLRLLKMSERNSFQFTVHLQSFLLSFHGLHQLHIQSSDCTKVDVDGIANYGETLTDLLVVNGDTHRQASTRCMNAGDLEKVAIACPSLKYLCLNPYELDPDLPEGDFLGPHPAILSQPTQFESALSAIANIRSLKSLRLTNPPNYRKSYHRPGEFMPSFRRSLENGEQRYAFKARADSIMRYLGDRDSNIRLLAFSPMDQLTKATSADKNGHIWSNYFYHCERMKGNRGAEISIARPVRDWRTEDPEATIPGDL